MKNQMVQNAGNRCSRPSERPGFAILTVIFIMVVFAILGMTTVSLITTSSQMTSDEYASEQAFHAADAGISYVAKVLATDADWSDNAGFTMAFGPDNFTISYVAKTATTATIRSDGRVGGITRSIQQMLVQGGGLADAFKSAFYTEGNITASGSSTGTVDGPVSAGGTVSGGDNIVYNGDIEQNNTSSDIPQPIWSYWQSHATTIIDGNYTFPPGTFSGIYYVTGNVGFSGNVTLNGTIATLGSVSLGGNSNIHITATSPNPAIIAQGSVTFAGTSDVTISGFIITLSTLTMTGTSDVVVSGGMVAQTGIELTGNTNADVSYVSTGGSVPGFSGGEGGSGIGFGQWREVY